MACGVDGDVESVGFDVWKHISGDESVDEVGFDVRVVGVAGGAKQLLENNAALVFGCDAGGFVDGHDAFPGRDVSELVDALGFLFEFKAFAAYEAVVDVAKVKVVALFVFCFD